MSLVCYHLQQSDVALTLVDDSTRFAALDESVHGLVNFFNALCSRELHADSSLVLRNNLVVQTIASKRRSEKQCVHSKQSGLAERE